MVLALIVMVLSFAPGAHGGAAVAQAAPAAQSYRVYIRPRLQSFGYAGELKLRFSNDGYVTGTYRPQTGGGLETVRGGRQGKKIWFDISTLGGIHVEATIDSGGISGVAAPTGMGTETYVFSAKPESSP